MTVLCNGEGMTSDSFLSLVLSIMLFPRDEEEQRFWNTRYFISKLHYKHDACINLSDKKNEIDCYGAVGFMLAMHARSLGGWEELSRALFSRPQQAFREKTLTQAVKGLLVGKILNLAFENNGNISNACELASKSFILTNETSLTCVIKKQDDPEYIRKKYWYEFNSVAHLWCAMTEYFQTAAQFADIVVYDHHPFHENFTVPSLEDGLNIFLQKSKTILEKAIGFQTRKGRHKPLLDIAKCQCDFDLSAR